MVARRHSASVRTRSPAAPSLRTQVTAVSGNTITISYDPVAGPAGMQELGALPTGSTLTFSVPSENTNFLPPGPDSLHLRL